MQFVLILSRRKHRYLFVIRVRFSLFCLFVISSLDLNINSFQSAMLLLKIDDIVSGAKSKEKQAQKKAPVAEPTEESMKE